MAYDYSWVNAYKTPATAENQAIHQSNLAATNPMWTPEAVKAKQATYSQDYATRRAAEAYLVNNLGGQWQSIPMGQEAYDQFHAGFQPGQAAYTGDTNWLKQAGYTGYQGPAVSYWKNPQVVNPPSGAGGLATSRYGAGGLGTGGYNQLPAQGNGALYGGLSFPLQPQWLPKTNIGNPGSSFELYPGLADMMKQMSSATPNMDIWGPAMDEAARRLTQVWQEQTLPGIRSEAQAAGQLGGPRNALQLQGASDKFMQNLGNAQNLLMAQAAQSAQDQRNLAAQLGLDVTKLQDASRIADIQGLLDQARIYEAGRATNLQTMLSDLSRRESGRQADLNAMVGMRGQDYNYDLGWGQLGLGRDTLQSNQALALLGLQQNAQLGGLGQLLPMLQAQGYPAGLLGNLGNYQYGRDAAYLGDAGRIYGGAVQGPLGALQNYNSLIGNPYGTQTQYSYAPSPLQGAIGGALTGYGIYNQGTQNNWW